MRPPPLILATGAMTVVLLTPATAQAQAVPAEGKVRARSGASSRDYLSIARQQIRQNLANQLRPFYRYELMQDRKSVV